jgi:hypothetical protein
VRPGKIRNIDGHGCNLADRGMLIMH